MEIKVEENILVELQIAFMNPINGNLKEVRTYIREDGIVKIIGWYTNN